MLEFELPWAFALLPAPALIWWLAPSYRERRESIRVPRFASMASATGVKPAAGGLRLRRNVLQAIVAPLAWILVCTALARPQLVEPPVERIQSARDLMLAVDLSGSMDTPDMLDAQNNRIRRLDAVTDVLDAFISRRAKDRLGVIVFGNQAYLHAPFTLDHDLVRTLLAKTQAGMAGPQTMIGDAIGLSIKLFQTSAAQDKLLVLLTDGNDTGSRVPPMKAAGIAAENGITIHTVAVGDPAGSGEARMDLDTLAAIARVSGGLSFRADDREQLEEIYAEIDARTPARVKTTSYRPTRPLYHWPMGAALLLIVLFHTIMMITTALRGAGNRHA